MSLREIARINELEKKVKSLEVLIKSLMDAFAEKKEPHFGKKKKGR